ncbi:MAG: glycosyltransferase family 2 protein [Candidatus Eiseniibacteriota bacterium]
MLIPAYDEAQTIAATIRSVQRQTRAPDAILVIDDGSRDGTGAVARSLGVQTLRTPRNRGCKALALNYGLQFVDTEITLAVDADTTFDPDSFETLLAAFDDEDTVAACGAVLPRRVKTIWERGRYVEYLLAFGFFRPIQDYYEKPLLASGCFSAYRTRSLREAGGWPSRTIAEDVDLTWRMYVAGKKVRYVAGAVCYPIEPSDLGYLSRQLRRWCCGFMQALKVHWRGVAHVPFLRIIVAIALWDAVILAIVLLILLPILAVLVQPAFLLGYLIDLPMVVVPVMIASHRRGEMGKALGSLPGYFVLRFVNAWFVLAAVWQEFVVNRPLVRFEKGH